MAPQTILPASSNTVRVRMFDSTTKLAIQAQFFVHPLFPGHEVFNLTSVGFLIENKRQNRRVVFDLGCRKDFWNFPPAAVARLEKILTGIRVEKNASEVLVEAGIALNSVDTVIWSHSHFDHIGDISSFPPTTKLVVGPNFRKTFLPAYPENPESRLNSALFENRIVEEIDMSRGGPLRIANFDAVDYFGDGSFYLLSAPGHAVDQVCGLARTTSDTFVFMGGDVAHFPGELRPTETIPLPDTVSANCAKLNRKLYTMPCPCSAFDHLRTTDDGNVNASFQHRREPFYGVSRSEHSTNVDPHQARADLEKVQKLDANPNVLVCLAHDPTLLDVLPVLNDDPTRDLNKWREYGWKNKCHWQFLAEMPGPGGQRAKALLVEGIWCDGNLVESVAAYHDAV